MEKSILTSFKSIDSNQVLSISLPIITILVLAAISNSSQAIATSSVDPAVADLEIDLTYVNGDMADYHGIGLKIYQDNSNLPIKTIDSISGNPYSIPLPVGHQYKIESYASSMLATIGYVDLDANKKLKLGMPVPGSLRFTVVYNDGYTPIDNATVMVKSTDGTYEYWTNSTTDDVGSTIRFWLQPTVTNDNSYAANVWLPSTNINDNYYAANVFLGNALSYSYYPISVLPGLSGDIKIITPWPAKLPPVTVHVYKSDTQTLSRADGNFAVRLYDDNSKEISESKINAIGQTTFSDLKVGRYVFQVIDLNDPSNGDWNATAILDGKQNSVQIFKMTNNTSTQDNSVDPNTSVFHTQIPIWVKNNAKWWAQNQVNDSDFISGIQFLVEHGIVKIPPMHYSQVTSNQIPSWIRSNAEWWARGQMSDNDFVNGIQYMISSGIMKIQYSSDLALPSVSLQS